MLNPQRKNVTWDTGPRRPAIGAPSPRRFAAPGLRIAVALLVLLGVFFRFYRLDGKVFWEDEILGSIHSLGFTEAEIVRASPRLVDAAAVQGYLRPPSGRRPPVAATIRSLALEDPQHPPGYYILANLWTRAFGASARSVRALSAAVSLLTLPGVYWLSLVLFESSEIALVAVALVAVSPFFVLYAQEAREYSLWTVCILVDALVFLHAVSTARTALWIAYAAVTALSLYVYPLTGLVALGFGAYLLVRDRRRPTRALAAWGAASLGALIAFTPWLYAMASSRGVELGMSTIMRQKLTPTAVAAIFARDLRFLFFDWGTVRLGPLGSTAINAALTVLALALIGVALLVAIRRRPFAVWGFVVVGLCLPMTPLLLQDLLVRGHFVYQARYFIPLLLGAELAVAALLAGEMFSSSSAAARRAWVAMSSIVLAGGLLSCVASARADTWWNKAYERNRSVAEVVNAARRPMVVSDYFSPSALALAYYLDPSVAMHLSLRCVQCTVAQPPSTGVAKGDDSVFFLQAEGAQGRGRWIDPQPFPARADALSMFAPTASSRFTQ